MIFLGLPLGAGYSLFYQKLQKPSGAYLTYTAPKKDAMNWVQHNHIPDNLISCSPFLPPAITSAGVIASFISF